MKKTSFNPQTVILSLSKSLSLLVICLFTINSSYARASLSEQQAVDANHSPQSGELLLTDQQNTTTPAPSLHTEVSMEITGLTARVKVVQLFENQADQWVEGKYLFPLPENAAVDRLSIRVGERVIKGEIQEKQQAIRTYQAAKISGRKASLVEQHRANVFVNSVANIGPYEIIEVSIEYQQDVSFNKEQGFSIRFPMTITPRYRPNKIMQEVFFTGKSKAIDNPISNGPSEFRSTYLPPDNHQASDDDQVESVKNTVKITVNLDAGFALSKVASASHTINDQQMTEKSYVISLADYDVKADRDFVLNWKPTPSDQPRAAIFTEVFENQHYLNLMVLPPMFEAPSKVADREIIFVLDTSGSMSGESIIQAKQALLFGLETLTPEDQFNIIQFNSTSHKLFTTAVDASAMNKSHAKSYILGLVADGGTEMAQAIDMASQSNQDSNQDSQKLRQVIFITDGAVSNESELFQRIEKRLTNDRLFTVGIGSAPNTFFMRKAAKFGRGKFTYIANLKDARIKIEQLLSAISRPMLTHLTLDWPSHILADDSNSRIPDLYEGEPLWLKAKLSELSGQLKLSGRINNTQWISRFSLDQLPNQAGVAALWARERIGSLMEQSFHGAVSPEDKNKIIQLALKHHLVSRFTSLVAVDKTPSRTAEVLKSKSVQSHFPKGTKPVGTIKNNTPQGQKLSSTHHYPQTSLDLAFTIRWSLLALLFSLVALFSIRRLC